jgi:hypothetical protein
VPTDAMLEATAELPQLAIILPALANERRIRDEVDD